MHQRLSTGIRELDRALGGGLLPGSLTMLCGATGVGKTQLGLQFSQAGVQAEGHPAAVIDLSSRGDSQNHSGYSQRMFSRELSVAQFDTDELPSPFEAARPADVLPFLGYGGRRVLRSQMDTDQWHAWQSELNRRMPLLFRFVYGHLVHGTRRFLVDGIEPQASSADSLQLDLLELIYHRMLKQEHDWLAREVLREKFRENEQRVRQQAYPSNASAAVVLVTTKSTLLQELMTMPLADGGMGRALYVAKHRGSYALDRILPFEIDDSGIHIAD